MWVCGATHKEKVCIIGLHNYDCEATHGDENGKTHQDRLLLHVWEEMGWPERPGGRSAACAKTPTCGRSGRSNNMVLRWDEA